MTRLLLLITVLTCVGCGSGNLTSDTPVAGVSLNKDTARIAVGGTEQLIATVTPEDATNQNIVWASSADATATVSAGGLVTRIVSGTVTITATTVDGKFTGSFTVEDVTVPVFILGGQSNMSGDGKTAALYDSAINDDPGLNGVQRDVGMWWSNVYGSVTDHQWVDLRPDMMNPNQFGPEISLGRTLADSLGEKVYFIKVAQGGSSLQRDWTPGGGGSLFMYDIFMQEISLGLQALRNAGLIPEIRGMFWHQGETDARSYSQASQYEDNLRGFIANARAVAGNPRLPFFIGELGAIYPLSIYPYKSTVVAAQNAVVSGQNITGDTYLIKTSDLGLLIEEIGGIETGVHYDSAGYLVLGERFADAYLARMTSK